MAWRLTQLGYDKGTICRFSKGCRTHQQGKLPENDGKRSSYIWRKTTFHTHQSFPLVGHQWHWPRHSFRNQRNVGCAFWRIISILYNPEKSSINQRPVVFTRENTFSSTQKSGTLPPNHQPPLRLHFLIWNWMTISIALFLFTSIWVD